ncbi:putative lipase [Porphyridium purpureum]|uniref:Putative lipase n=1 Tax=Porphyridium purpureum TaxID=35688 RepID=A0A5J4YPB3_PORPP|nr:putative lipase [Porphyridium purpureum]|eukprot:POR4798..scf296_7
MLGWQDGVNLSLTLALLALEMLLRFASRVVRWLLPRAVCCAMDDAFVALTRAVLRLLPGFDARAQKALLDSAASSDVEEDEDILNTSTGRRGDVRFQNGSASSAAHPRARVNLLELDAVGLIYAFGYKAEEHVVTTPDGYVLSLFRILPKTAPGPRREGGGDACSATAPSGHNRGMPVLLMHGFLECCEIWVCRGKGHSLAFMLVDAGFDVFLGNVRGNKYGYKHVSLNAQSREFWDFCMDSMVKYDLPANLEACMRISNNAPQIAYIGFSQGSALGFAAFSTNLELASKIALFCALAPSTRVNGLKPNLINTIVNSDPNVLYVLFGHRIMMRWVIFWRTVLPPDLFVRGVDASCLFLFGWTMRNVDESEKALMYAHLYSYSSVKTMVHWSQIIVTRKFQMFDDEIGGSYTNWRRYRGHSPPQYPLHQLSVPVALFCGGTDSLPDTKWLLGEICDPVHVTVEPQYEHLDFQLASSAPSIVYPKIINLLSARASHTVTK